MISEIFMRYHVIFLKNCQPPLANKYNFRLVNSQVSLYIYTVYIYIYIQGGKEKVEH